MAEIELYHGDCLEVMVGMPSGSVDVVLTDPPFSSGTRKEGSKGVRRSMVRSMEDEDWYSTDCLTTHGFMWLMRQCAFQWRRLLKRGGHVFVFIDWRMAPHLAAAVESVDLRHKMTLVWNKVHFGMGDCFRNQHEFILHFTHGMGRKPARRDVGSSERETCPASPRDFVRGSSAWVHGPGQFYGQRGSGSRCLPNRMSICRY
jgi:DNA modification methylase